MFINQHWFTRVAGRVLSSAIIGGVVSAIVGALCVGAAGALFGWLLDIRSTPASWDSGFLFPGAWVGMSLGAWSGFVGLIAAGLVAFDMPSRHSFAPLRALLGRVAIGQLLGTLGAISSYLLLAWAIAQTQGQPFVGTVEDNLDLIIWAAPAAMIGGAIAGALWKRTNAMESLVVN